MTAEPETPPVTGSEGDPPAPAGDRLPDDHPVVKALAKANKEAEAARLRLKEIDDANKTELQKAKDELSERDQRLSELPKAIRAQAIKFASKATAMGFLDPEDALVFIDADLADDAAVKAALEDLAERKPHLVRPTEPTPKVPRRPRPKSGDVAPDDDSGAKGKERAAAALRQFSTTR